MKRAPVDDGARLLDIREAAALLNVSATSLRRWTDAGTLPCLRVGRKRERRFRRDDLIAFLENQGGESSGPAQMHLEGLAIDYGSHLCAVYQSDHGRDKLAVPFLADGLRDGDTCYLMASSAVCTALAERLGEVRPAIAQDIAARRLVIVDTSRSPDEILDFFEREFCAATRDGAASLRVLGDVAVMLDGGADETLIADVEMRYERRLARSYPVVTLCLYDARRFSGSGVLTGLKCHVDTFSLPLSRFLVG